MRDEQRTRIRRLSLWFSLNLLIFISCYLNYRLQLKHRYLYKTLNAGLCFSRAAAMVINFNLLLVWLPMCKYSITRLACLANQAIREQKRRLQAIWEGSNCKQGQLSAKLKQRSPLKRFKASLGDAVIRVKCWLCLAKLNSINSFLFAIDHCKSLHTICATTITIASVIHTVAHLVNVINFSRNFDPLLNNLNMAEYKGQNPLQLLISVPGITGCLMIVILILMSLSSVDFIRNSCFDLFQILHRLSIIFVVLLLLHPSSHVLKEQSNVDRHNPELCYERMLVESSNKTATHSMAAIFSNSLTTNATKHFYSRQGLKPNSTATSALTNNLHVNDTRTTTAMATATTNDLNHAKTDQHQGDSLSSKVDKEVLAGGKNSTQPTEGEQIAPRAVDSGLCLDSKPLFTAQSSICWYVLSIGLSCYLLDLLLRKLRRSKGTIELLGVRLDSEGNLIELMLNNNHKRFAHWLPGQFVYLNCPQIAAYEWHPFTISSMDDKTRQFTLHIKTAGDWTRKLRQTLEETLQSSILLPAKHDQLHHSIIKTNFLDVRNLIGVDRRRIDTMTTHSELPVLSGLNCYNRLDLDACVRSSKSKATGNNNERSGRESVRINLSDNNSDQHQQQKGLYSICQQNISTSFTRQKPLDNGQVLDLFIDGPFHSPFERLLEQQVSVCIANGVGWTAFSSVFPCIINNFTQAKNDPNDWWSKWRNFAIHRPKQTASTKPNQQSRSVDAATQLKKLSNTKLHLMVIVTSIEQLKPFYNLALNYFSRFQDECQVKVDDQLNPVREITAFITRASREDYSVKDFCKQEKLSTTFDQENRAIRVNKVFSIQFGKPKFEFFLKSFSAIHPDSRKISVYCCGSNQVKKVVHEICQDINKGADNRRSKFQPTYSYHEENF